MATPLLLGLWVSEGEWQSLLQCLCATNVDHSCFLDIYSLKTVPLQKWLLLRLAKPVPLIQVYGIIHLSVQLYIINTVSLIPAFPCAHVAVFVFFFIPLLPLVSSSPWSHGRTQHLIDLMYPIPCQPQASSPVKTQTVRFLTLNTLSTLVGFPSQDDNIWISLCLLKLASLPDLLPGSHRACF